MAVVINSNIWRSSAHVFSWKLEALSGNITFRFRRCFTSSIDIMNDLTKKKCVPCNSKDLRPMTEDAAKGLVRELAEWNLINEDGKLKLNRSLKVKSFLKGMELFELIAEVAEAEGHHPNLHLVGWNNVTIEIWTDAVGGLTENDFILASKINKLDAHHLLSLNASISSQHDC
ncbi:hypothetical protein SDJN02_10484, partial [Cucurbita argyrosperma subsp. argyrosperma]